VGRLSSEPTSQHHAIAGQFAGGDPGTFSPALIIYEFISHTKCRAMENKENKQVHSIAEAKY